ncbi:MAG: HlyD family secretion protein [Lachnospiraceae bacterium]
MKNWINKQKIGIIFLAAILLLTFFSKTIYTYHLPEVTAVLPAQGLLSKVETGYGTVTWAAADSIYIPAKGTVGELHVLEGEYVKVGQPLLSMVYDREENDWKLGELENSRAAIQNEIQNIQIKIAAAKRPDAELLNVRQSASEAEKNLNAAQIIYAVGGISEQELREAGNELNYLQLKLENMTREAAEQQELLRLELEAKELELENLALQEEPYKKARNAHDNQVILTAPADGMLISLPVAVGQKVDKDTLAAEIGTGNEYILECSVSLENDFVVPGDTCNLSNSSHQVKGVVSAVQPTQQQKLVRIRFTADNVTAGETFEVLFRKQGEAGYTLVPNAAINKDNNGYYLKQIKRRDGMMGKEYYLDRLDIYIGDSDAQNTAVIQGITFFEPVLLSSDKTADTGDTVILKNAGDFFEK